MTDFALMILKKHEERVAREKKTNGLGKLQAHIDQMKKEAYAQVNRKGTTTEDAEILPLFMAPEAISISDSVVCDASDEELIAFNSCMLVIGG